MNDPFEILKKDHDKVKGLFEEYEKCEEPSDKKKIVEQIVVEISLHTSIEEQYFYPKLQGINEELNAMVNEAVEEHRQATEELMNLRDIGSKDETVDAVFKVFSEDIMHHVKEEEEELFPLAQKALTDEDKETMAKNFMKTKEEEGAK